MLKDLNAGDEVEYTLVGEDEADVTKGLLSVQSPVGRALLGKEEGDEVVVRRPKGELVLEVVRVDYDPPER